MTRLLKYFKEYKLTSVLGPLFKLLEAVFELIIPLVVKRIIDNGIAVGDKGYCIQMSLVLVLLGFLGFVFSIIAQYFAAKSAVGFAANVRSALFAHVHSLSYSDIDKLGTSTMITRLTSDINQVQNGVNMGLRLLLRSPFIVFGAMIMAFTQDVKSALLFVVVIPILSVIVFSIIAYTIPKYKQVQARVDKVLGLTRENVNGVRVIRAFCNEDSEEKKFNDANDSLNALQLKVGRISALMNPLTYVIINAAIMFLIYACGVRVNNGLMTAGVTVALYNYMSQILVELVKLANLIITITKALACANRIADVMDIEPGMTSGSENVDIITKPDESHSEKADTGSLTPVVEFDHASLAYNKGARESLSDVSLKVYQGETVGVIGGTGCGKTSFVHLIPRFYDATEGTVKVFGKDVKELDLKQLRNRIGIVMQKAVLFKGDVESNLAFANEYADNNEMVQALKDAQASAFLNLDSRDKKGLSYSVEQGGNNMSGGQKQRISIARALVKKPDILILDDSASALDYATDAALRTAIKNLNPKPTTFIVSQRSSSVQYADKIVVLDDGRVSGIGTHEQLLETNEIYREIYYSQVSAN
ncbi:MAG: ABC transporter ATP-binding protein [Lachnospiraceae bacterium]|nr:ABC transporter ATP-binding protein [Lachnospiraceae bacterium]